MSGRLGRPKMVGVRRAVPHYVYRCYDDSGVLLYIGCTNHPAFRIQTHRDSAWWRDRFATVRFTVFPDRDYALRVERRAIYIERPECNVRGRWYADDPREDWTLEDYRTYRLAVYASAGGWGVATGELLRRIDAEVLERFGVRLLTQESA